MRLITRSLCNGVGPFFRRVINEPAFMRPARKKLDLKTLGTQTGLAFTDWINDEPSYNHSWAAVRHAR
jgi:hypothetical protein